MFVRKFLIILAFLVLLSCRTEKKDLIQRFLIVDNWSFCQEGDTTFFPASIPGTIHTDLFRNKIIEDPYYGCNEEALQWIGECNWIYKTEFVVDKSLLSKTKIFLVFEGLDTFSEVFLNGENVLVSNNMHRKWTVDCKDFLVIGKNTLEVRFISALSKAAEDSISLGYKIPGGKWAFSRKAAYHFGWDWGPKFITSGIFKPVYIESWDYHRPGDFYVFTKEIGEESANIRLLYQIESEITEKAVVKISDTNTGEVFTKQKVDLAPGNNEYVIDFIVKNPAIWWSNGLGEPNIYELSIELHTESGYSYIKELPFGIRTLKAVLEDDEIGQALYIELNGQKVYAKGANYIPQNSFITEVTKQNYQDIINLAVESNMNMIRVWGGGIYENDIFYELCNRNGIMVWQDFMFACSMYPGNDDFVENVTQEATQQVKRLRNHSNIALWCGNNEVDEGWHNWGWQKSYSISSGDSAIIWEGYKKVFHQLLPDIVNEIDPQRFYLSTSPLYGWGRAKSMTHGSSHYWGVWWGLQPAEMYLEKVPRFMSEFGLQALPTLSTIRSFQNAEDDYLFSPSLNCHQKHPTGFENIAKYLNMESLKANNLEELIYYSQIVQAKGIGLAIEAQRRAKPYCMGTLYWQLNDCWPVVSWSGTDFFGNWKALQYRIRDLFDDVMVSIVDNKEILEAYVVSDRLEDSNGKFIISIVDFFGNRKDVFSEDLVLKANSSKSILSEKLDKIFSGVNMNEVMVEAVFIDESGKRYINQKFFAKLGNVKLYKPNIKHKVAPTEGGFIVTLNSDIFAAYVQLYLSEDNAHFDKNFFHLFPNEEIVVFCKSDLSLRDFLKQLKIFCLNNNQTIDYEAN
ncbi:MAG: glycoside hydrolase family 2 protein [Bacteroidetes bacterium]|nr:glycoside hydrolase family 2 protein [Bacteroidota bacterium]